MTVYQKFWGCCLRLFAKGRAVLRADHRAREIDRTQPILYLVPHAHPIYVLLMQQQCERLGLPSLYDSVSIGSHTVPRTFVLSELSATQSLIKKTDSQGAALCVALLEHSAELKVQLVPITIFWGRWDSYAYTSSSIRAQGWAALLLELFFYGRNVRIHFDPPLRLESLVPDSQGNPEGRALRLLSFFADYFEKKFQAVAGSQSGNGEPAPTVQQCLRAQNMHPVLEAHRQSTGQTYDQVAGSARTLLSAMVATPASWVIRLQLLICGPILRKLFGRTTFEGSEPVHQAHARGDMVVYLPCHKSHFDSLLLTLQLIENDLPPPCIAAGDNLNIWPIGPVLRKGGAFFIHRRIQNDPFYAQILGQYVAALVQPQSRPVAFFIEGARSRTGHFLPAKTGLLAMVIDLLRARVPKLNLSLVPVTITYEHIYEIDAYAAQRAGAVKKPETFWQLLRALRDLSPQGAPSVILGEPIRITLDRLEALGLVQDQDGKWKAYVRSIADSVMRILAQNRVITATALEATARLLGYEKRPDALDPLSSAPTTPPSYPLLSLLESFPRAMGVRLGAMAGNPRAPLRMQASHHPKAEELPTQASASSRLLEHDQYYANSIADIWVLPALLASHLLARKQAWNGTQLLEACSALYPFFDDRFGLPWDACAAQALLEQFLSSWLARSWIRIEASYLTLHEPPEAFYDLQTLIQPWLIEYARLLFLSRSADAERSPASLVPALLCLPQTPQSRVISPTASIAQERLVLSCKRLFGKPALTAEQLLRLEAVLPKPRLDGIQQEVRLYLMSAAETEGIDSACG